MDIILIFILFIFITSLIFKVNAYDAFCEGVKKSYEPLKNIFTSVLAVTILIELINVCGIDTLLPTIFENQTLLLFIFRMFSSSSAQLILFDNFKTYGVNSLSSIQLSYIYLCSDAFLYIGTIYYSSVKKKLSWYMVIASFLTFLCTTLYIVFFIKS